MPWGNKTVEEQRIEFLQMYASTGNMSQTCKSFNITRKTGYKWLKRAMEGECLTDRSRAPGHPSNKTAPGIERLILAVREDNPSWGGRMIRDYLLRQGRLNLPCARTCHNILSRYGCIDAKESLKHKPYIRFERAKCNELWQTDFKGDFGLLDGSRCYPLTILDDHSRYSIKIDVKPNTRGVLDSFRHAFGEYGVPMSVLSDNGAQFAGFRGGYTIFERWLMEHDVLPVHGRIMHPQTQGKIERFHRTMKHEFLKYREFNDLDDANMQIQEWRIKYNEFRPHLALGSKVPADVYSRSARKFTDKVEGFEYAGYVRKVNNKGYLRFSDWQIYLSETMANTYLEILESAEDSFYVYFRNFRIAEIDAHHGTLINRKIFRR